MQDVERRYISNPDIAIMPKDIDFAELELRILGLGTALLADMREITGVAEVILKSGVEDVLAEITAAMVEAHRKRDQRKNRPPSYLQHDPTKHHRGRRPK
jgi:hypothetical protein